MWVGKSSLNTAVRLFKCIYQFPIFRVYDVGGISAHPTRTLDDRGKIPRLLPTTQLRITWSWSNGAVRTKSDGGSSSASGPARFGSVWRELKAADRRRNPRQREGVKNMWCCIPPGGNATGLAGTDYILGEEALMEHIASGGPAVQQL